MRVREWLIRSADVRGQVGRAGFLSRPAVPSRARASSQCRGAGCVVEELSVDGVGDPSLEASQRFEVGLSCGALTPVVGPALGVEADLAECGHVQHVVDLAVAGA
jgi:hypothetical protein